MNGTRERLLHGAMRHFAAAGDRQINVITLARAASVARGTVYSHFPDIRALFDIVTAEIADRQYQDMLTICTMDVPAHEKLAHILAGMLQKAHEDATLAHYLVQFAPNTAALRDVWTKVPPALVRESIDTGVMTNLSEGVVYYIQMIAGTTYAFIVLVAEGRKSWRDAARHLIHLCLSASGTSRAEAERVSRLFA